MTDPSPAPTEDATDMAAEATAPDARRDLPPAAQRALAEAEERRRKAVARTPPPEVGGRRGPDPVRYGDWERKGIAIDF